MPSIGRFTTVDPARSEWNWMAYVRNRPVMLTDAAGLATVLRTCCPSESRQAIEDRIERLEQVWNDFLAGIEYGKPGGPVSECIETRGPMPDKPVIHIPPNFDAFPCLKLCIIAHEQRHAVQCIILGRCELYRRRSDPNLRVAVEKPAWAWEFACLRAMLEWPQGECYEYSDPYNPRAPYIRVPWEPILNPPPTAKGVGR
jgi:hypothetical protein